MKFAISDEDYDALRAIWREHHIVRKPPLKATKLTLKRPDATLKHKPSK